MEGRGCQWPGDKWLETHCDLWHRGTTGLDTSDVVGVEPDQRQFKGEGTEREGTSVGLGGGRRAPRGADWVVCVRRLDVTSW